MKKKKISTSIVDREPELQYCFGKKEKEKNKKENNMNKKDKKITKKDIEKADEIKNYIISLAEMTEDELEFIETMAQGEYRAENSTFSDLTFVENCVREARILKANNMVREKKPTKIFPLEDTYVEKLSMLDNETLNKMIETMEKHAALRKVDGLPADNLDHVLRHCVNRARKIKARKGVLN